MGLGQSAWDAKQERLNEIREAEALVVLNQRTNLARFRFYVSETKDEFPYEVIDRDCTPTVLAKFRSEVDAKYCVAIIQQLFIEGKRD